MPVMSSSEPSAGPDLSEIYVPPTPAPAGDGSAPPPAAGLGEMLLAKGVVTAERLTVAQQVIKASPGKRLADVLIEQGVDEAAVQAAVAEFAGIPFERINLEKGLDGGFDGKLIQRLTPEFCKRHMLIPLRTEGSRVVIGATQADNVFLLDEVRQALGGPGQAPGVKLVLVTAFDVKGALEIVGGGAAPAEDVSKILSEVEDADVQVEKKT